MVEELLKKIPTEKCWAITAKILTGFISLRTKKTNAPVLGKGEGIISPVWGWEKYEEVHKKIWGDGGRKFIPWVKDTFNISVEDAIGAAKLYIIAIKLLSGTEGELEIVEATPERVVVRITKCSWWERHKEFERNPEFVACPSGHQVWGEEGLKAISHKLTFKRTKAMPRGDSYCEAIIEFKEE